MSKEQVLKWETVSVIDTKKWKLTKQITVGQRPVDIHLGPDKRIVFVAVYGDGKVAVIDVETLEVKEKFVTAPGRMASPLRQMARRSSWRTGTRTPCRS